MRPSDKWENLAEIMRAIEPSLEARLQYCRSHPPDPVKQPVASAIIAAYIHRLELALSAIRGGAHGLKDEATNRPESMQEMQEFESWILRRKHGIPRRKLTEKDEDVLGDWFVSKQGHSYSKARQMIEQLRALQSGKGAPHKRPEALKLMDAKVSNDWTYKELASQMCDCESIDGTHTAHCEDRLRKRINEVESFLAKYKITYSRSAR